MSKYICIAGHGKMRSGAYDPGAIGIVGGEHKYMRDKLFPAMKKYAGSDFVFIDSYNVLSYGNLSNLARKYGKGSKVIEFHYDAFSNSTAKGGHVIIHEKYSPDSMDLRLRDTISKFMGVRYSHKGNNGISGRGNLGNVNRARHNSVNYRLIELGFGTNSKNANTMLNKTDELAKDLVSAIQGKPSKPGKPSVPNKPGKPSVPSKPSRPSAPSKPSSNISVDGYWGNATTRKLQKNLGTYQDGIISGQYRNNVTNAIPSVSFNGNKGSNVIRALQRKVGSTADGYVGVNTIRSLQKYLRTYQDGIVSRPSNMVKEMQRRLNAGTF